jgi:hypothetical protein
MLMTSVLFWGTTQHRIVMVKDYHLTQRNTTRRAQMLKYVELTSLKNTKMNQKHCHDCTTELYNYKCLQCHSVRFCCKIKGTFTILQKIVRTPNNQPHETQILKEHTAKIKSNQILERTNIISEFCMKLM